MLATFGSGPRRLVVDGTRPLDRNAPPGSTAASTAEADAARAAAAAAREVAAARAEGSTAASSREARQAAATARAAEIRAAAAAAAGSDVLEAAAAPDTHAKLFVRNAAAAGNLEIVPVQPNHEVGAFHATAPAIATLGPGEERYQVVPRVRRAEYIPLTNRGGAATWIVL